MALANSGMIGIGGSSPRSINVELGRAATATTSLGESASRTLAGVASGAIRMAADFWGKSSGGTVTIPDVSSGDNFNDPATASFRFERDGDAFYIRLFDATEVQAADWVSPKSATVGDGYWIRVTKTAGDNLSTGTVGSWLQLNSNRTWTLQQSGSGSKSSTVTIEIATDSGGSNIVDTRTGVTLEVSVL